MSTPIDGDAVAPNRVETWRRGYPPGPYYPGMERDFEVYFSPGGVVWHRRAMCDAALPDEAP